MNAKIVVSYFILLVLLVASGCSRSDPLKKFQGEWSFAEINSEGKKIEAKVLKFMSVKVNKEEFQIFVNDKVGDDYIISVDDSKTPGEIDMVYVSGENKGHKEMGIYYFEGTDDKLRLKLLIGGSGVSRPTAFTAKAEEGQTLMVLDRK
jgi:uncharacterized protein (TIGR03067 family)